MLHKVKAPLSWGPPDYLNWDDRVPYDSTTSVSKITASAKDDAVEVLTDAH